MPFSLSPQQSTLQLPCEPPGVGKPSSSLPSFLSPTRCGDENAAPRNFFRADLCGRNPFFLQAGGSGLPSLLMRRAAADCSFQSKSAGWRKDFLFPPIRCKPFFFFPVVVTVDGGNFARTATYARCRNFFSIRPCYPWR